MSRPEPKGKIQVSVGLLPEQLRQVDSLAARLNTSRGAMLRFALEKGLAVIDREGLEPTRSPSKS